MSQSLSSGTFEEYDQKLNKLIAWMSDLGVNVDPSRIGAYRKSFDALLEVSNSKNEDEARDRFAEFMNTLYEVHELFEIYKGMSNLDAHDCLRPRLTTIASGPIEYLSETSSSANKARNYAFELLLASRLFVGGMGVQLTNHADVECKIHGQRVFFECKRPQSEAAIQRNIKKAMSQLKRRYASAITSKARGVVAIDITKAVNPDYKLLTYETGSEIGQRLSGVIDAFSNEHLRAIEESKHKKTIAVVVRMSIMAAPKGHADRLVYCQQY